MLSQLTSNQRKVSTDNAKTVKLTEDKKEGTETPSIISDDFMEDMFDQEEEYHREARVRAQRNCCFKCSYAIVTSTAFNLFIFLLILGNTVTLSLYYWDQSEL